LKFCVELKLTLVFADVERAVKIMDGFEHYSKKGVGAFVVDGKMYATHIKCTGIGRNVL
jgi:hypothetical protein